MQTPYPGISNLYILSNENRGKYVLLAVKICCWLQVLRMLITIMVARAYATQGMRHKLFSKLVLLDSSLGIPLNLFFPVVFMMWMARAYYNLHRTGIQKIQFSAGWSIGAWFVPFMNLVRPYKIMKELWYRKQLNFRNEEHEPIKHTSLRVWWGFYILPAVIGGFFAALALDTLNDVTVLYVFQAFVHCGLAVSLFALADVLRKLTVFEAEFRDRFLISQTQKVVELADAYRTEQGILSDANPSYQTFTVPQSGTELPNVLVDWKTANSFSRSATFCLIAIVAGTLWRLCANFLLFQNDSVSENPSAMLLTSAFAFVLLAFSILGTLYFILWLNRVYKNLIALKSESLSVRLEQLSYWWIIPGYNVYMLFVIMRDISLYYEEQCKKKSKVESISEPGVLLLSFLLGTMFWILSTLMDSGREYSDAEANLVSLMIIITPLAFGSMCVAAILFMRKVKTLSL